MKDEIANALRILVSAIYNDCYGAYGVGEDYYDEGYEDEIGACAEAIVNAIVNAIERKD